MQATLIIIAVYCLIAILISLVVLLAMRLTHLHKADQTATETKMELVKYTLRHKYSVKDSRELLEYLVDQKLNEWQIYNVDPDSENYMNEANMQDCIEYIIKRVVLELTPVMVDQLSVGYPMDTDEQIIESVKNVAKMAVLTFSVKQNSALEHEEVVKNIKTFE